MPKYLIQYYFDGQGEIEIKAKNQKEAREFFFNGDWDGKKEDEWGENYNIQEINKN